MQFTLEWGRLGCGLLRQLLHFSKTQLPCLLNRYHKAASQGLAVKAEMKRLRCLACCLAHTRHAGNGSYYWYSFLWALTKSLVWELASTAECHAPGTLPWRAGTGRLRSLWLGQPMWKKQACWASSSCLNFKKQISAYHKHLEAAVFYGVNMYRP